MAVPARMERLRGAQATSELARAGTIDVRASDGLSYDRLTFGHQPHPQRAALYTPCQNCQRFFVTNATKIRDSPFLPAYPQTPTPVSQTCVKVSQNSENDRAF
jgi:hypothetical protein